MTSINGEMLTGISLVFLAVLFIVASFFYEPWVTILPVDYLIMAIGIGFIVLGVVSVRRNKSGGHIEEHPHY